jgi:hypothetical protein
MRLLARLAAVFIFAYHLSTATAQIVRAFT